MNRLQAKVRSLRTAWVRIAWKFLICIVRRTHSIKNVYQINEIEAPGIFWCEYIGPCILAKYVNTSWTKPLDGYKLVLGKAEPMVGHYVVERNNGFLFLRKPSCILYAIQRLRREELEFDIQDLFGDS